MGLVSLMFVAVCVTTVVLFAPETAREKPEEIVAARGESIQLLLIPRSVDPGARSVSFAGQIGSDSSLISQDGLSLFEPIEVTFSIANWAKTASFSGQTLAATVDLAVDDGKLVLPTAIVMEAFESGWEIDATQITRDRVPGTQTAVPSIDFQATRALTTFAFAELPFATSMHRSFLPGSPPVGSWGDILVVLWVLVSRVAALPLIVTAWWRPAGIRALKSSEREVTGEYE